LVALHLLLERGAGLMQRYTNYEAAVTAKVTEATAAVELLKMLVSDKELGSGNRVVWSRHSDEILRDVGCARSGGLVLRTEVCFSRGNQ
jgi:hypothetical protein